MERRDTTWIVRMAAMALLGGMALSPALWGFADRGGFPLLPLLGDAIEEHAGIWQGLIASISVVLAFIFPEKKAPLFFAIACILILCAFDLNRLQPWVWYYLMVFLVGMLQGNALAFRWLLAGMYLWSGFNKLTPYFAEDNFSWFCEAFSFTKTLGKTPWLGYGMAALEMALGAGLVWGKTAKIAGRGLIGMHLIICIFLLKLGWNYVVIPWNIALALMAWRLTGTSPVIEHNGMESSLLRKKFLAPAVLVWLCPLLYFWGLWPHALSWHLYSNTQPEATFFSDRNSMPFLSPLHQIWEKKAFDNGTKLLIDDWANDVLKVPMFPSDHTFRQIGKYLCNCSTATRENSGLYILNVQPWRKNEIPLDTIGCAGQIKPQR